MLWSFTLSVEPFVPRHTIEFRTSLPALMADDERIQKVPVTALKTPSEVWVEGLEAHLCRGAS